MLVTQGVALGWHVNAPLALVSHLHRDLEQVREIRNELEPRGHHPLLFFLMRPEDDDEGKG